MPYQHCAETVSFDPFYLVWASTDASIGVDTETLPWPFQLTEILRFDRDAYFAPARPPVDAVEEIQSGFSIYTVRCGKCHDMAAPCSPRGTESCIAPLFARIAVMLDSADRALAFRRT